MGIDFIKACRDLGASRIKHGDLEIDFYVNQSVPHETIDKQLMEDIRLSQLMVENPVAFEEEMQRSMLHESVQN